MDVFVQNKGSPPERAGGRKFQIIKTYKNCSRCGVVDEHEAGVVNYGMPGRWLPMR